MKEKYFQDMIDEAKEAIANQQEIKDLAHYTSVDVLRKMVHSIQCNEDKNHLVFRATSIRFTNDSKEIDEGYQFLIKTLVSLERSSQIPEPLWLSTYLLDAEKSEKYHKYEKEDFFNWFYDGIRTPYIISFSRNVDDLKMWHKPYGRAGEGCCLVFDFSEMEYTNSQLSISYPSPVVYNNRIGYLNVTNEFLKAIYKEYKYYLGKTNGVKNLDDILDLKLQTIDSLCSFISSYIKNEKWHDEQEWRLVCTTNEEHSNYIKQDDTGRPYVEVPISLSCLNKIILGPKVEERIVSEFRNLANYWKLSPDNIYKSEEPLR